MLYYEQLKHGVFQHDLLVDNLIYKDVKLTTTNDDQYFVFEDYIYQVSDIVLKMLRMNSLVFLETRWEGNTLASKFVMQMKSGISLS